MQTQKLRNFKKRLDSYKNWRNGKNYIELASAGFRYTGYDDRVECGDCGIRIVQWTPTDDALQCHARLGPNCKFLDEIGLTSNHKLAKYSKYSRYKIRFESMSSIPTEYLTDMPSLELVAEAGFFYLGTLDRMCCYYCGIVMRDWEQTIDPFEVHQQYKPDCFFIVSYMSRKSGDDSKISNTLQLIENHQAMKQSAESFTYRISELISKLQNTNVTAELDPVENQKRTDISKKKDKTGLISCKPVDLPSSPDNTNCSNSSQFLESLPDSHFSLSRESEEEFDENDLFAEGVPSRPKTQGNCNYSEKNPFKILKERPSNQLKKNSPMSLQLPRSKYVSSDSSSSSGYGSFSSDEGVRFSKSLIHRQLEVTDSSTSDKLPSVYADCNFAKHPMVLAVLEMGFSYKQIVRVVSKHFRRNKYIFNDAQQLLQAILDDTDLMTQHQDNISK